jgi:hypothetical protein
MTLTFGAPEKILVNNSVLCNYPTKVVKLVYQANSCSAAEAVGANSLDTYSNISTPILLWDCEEFGPYPGLRF